MFNYYKLKKKSLIEKLLHKIGLFGFYAKNLNMWLFFSSFCFLATTQLSLYTHSVAFPFLHTLNKHTWEMQVIVDYTRQESNNVPLMH